MLLKPDSYFSSYEDQGRDPGVIGQLRFLEFDHLRHRGARNLSRRFAELARALLDALPDDPELASALGKLREAKDRAVGLGIASWGEEGALGGPSLPDYSSAAG
jgi:hypothetical protein